MTWTSQCVIVDEDIIHLVGVGVGEGAEDLSGTVDVTLGAYDAANLRYSGTEVGTVLGANDAVYDVNQGVSFYYHAGTGSWLLDGFWIEELPLELC